MRTTVWALPVFLILSALPGFSLGHANSHHARHAAAQAPAEAAGPVTVYGDAIPWQPDTSDGPVTVIAGIRQPAVAGQPEIVYGDAASAHVYEVAAATDRSASLPLTAYAGAREVVAEGMPETVYAGADMHPNPVNEAQLAANEITGEGMAENEAPEAQYADNDSAVEDANDASAAPYPPGYYLPQQNGLPLFQHGQALPKETASPYSPYTDAQRAGMNPCENKQPNPSPYGPLTDAQRAGQTNCR